ncbi:MAG: hypothetical protein ACK5PP_02625 [Acidimicrobiales bacterium]
MTGTGVVQYHPLEASFSAAVRNRVLTGLEQVGEPVRAWRLAAREQPTGSELARIRRLILIYPTWDGGLPAVVLGWIHGLLDDPAPLVGVEELVAMTTCGSSRMVNLLQGQWGRHYLRTRLAPACHGGTGARFRWRALYRVDRADRGDMAAHLRRVGAEVTRFAAPPGQEPDRRGR